MSLTCLFVSFVFLVVCVLYVSVCVICPCCLCVEVFVCVICLSSCLFFMCLFVPLLPILLPFHLLINDKCNIVMLFMWTE